MIKVIRTITESKNGDQSTWITTRKVFLLCILVYNYRMEETGSNVKKPEIGFQTGGISPLHGDNW